MPSKTQVETLTETNLPDNASPKIRSQKHREVEKAIVEYATCVIKMTSTAGSTIVSAKMVGREVGAVVIDDITKNQGFSKPTPSDTLTFTDGTQLGAGQAITIFLA